MRVTGKFLFCKDTSGNTCSHFTLDKLWLKLYNSNPLNIFLPRDTLNAVVTTTEYLSLKPISNRITLICELHF